MTDPSTPLEDVGLTEAEARKALENLIVGNEDLERLEALIAQFNIFEAIGAVRQELRHSELLAFLLNPSENHGLGDSFLKRLLQRVVASDPTKAPFSPVDLDVWELDEVEVRREWRDIDILIVDSRNKVAVLIENKIDSAEHSDQLRRYWDVVANELRDHKLLGLFLTPDADEPSDGRYLEVGYGDVATVVGQVLTARSSTIGPDVQTLLRHYEQMLRRHIVSESEIAELCRKLYRKHKHALDLIFAHRPDPRQGNIRELAEELVGNRSDFVLDDSPRSYLRFAPKVWDVPKLKRMGGGWTRSGRMLLFEVAFASDRVFLKLTLGPGPGPVRDGIFRVAQARPELFKGSAKTLSPKWHQLFQHPILDAKMLASEDAAAIETTVRAHWETFTAKELPALLDALAGEVGEATSAQSAGSGTPSA